MKKMLRTILACVILTNTQALALEVTSLAPTRGTPGTLAAISGGPFSEQTQPFLGEQYVAPRVILPNYLEFTIPPLPPGDYLLTVQDQHSSAAQTHRFEVMAPTPRIAGIEPRTLDVCSLSTANQLQIDGADFLPGAVLLVNDIVVASRVVNTASIEAQMPELRQPGVYGVKVRNPDGAESLPHSLSVDNSPAILSVERGDDAVNSYEIIIRGKNFLFNSILVVVEPDSSPLGQTYQQLSFVPRNNTTTQAGVDTLAPQRNRLIYVDCQTLIYQRRPTTFQDKNLGLQVFNPDGRSTELYFVSMP